MPSASVDMLRAAFEAFNHGNWEAALARAHPDIEWRLHGALAFDVPEPVKGRDNLVGLWTEFFDVWDAYRMDPLDFTEGSDGSVLVTVSFTAQGAGSSAPIELTYFWVHRFGDGAILSVDLYTDRSEALEAAGLPA